MYRTNQYLWDGMDRKIVKFVRFDRSDVVVADPRTGKELPDYRHPAQVCESGYELLLRRKIIAAYADLTRMILRGDDRANAFALRLENDRRALALLGNADDLEAELAEADHYANAMVAALG